MRGVTGSTVLAAARLGCVFALAALAPAPLAAQLASVVGSVRDASTGTPLEGVVVTVGERSGVSRADGRFLLLQVPVGEAVVRAERLGYAVWEREVTLGAGQPFVLEIALRSEPLALDGVVVSGLAGESRRREIGSAVAKVEVQNLREPPVFLSDILQGAATGVEITGGSGEAGQGKQIRLRGNASVTRTSQPLIYIDGVPMMRGGLPGGPDDFAIVNGSLIAGANVTTTPLDMVNPQDIERVEIVRGPAAATLFGTGAGGGVIQIFTKRGRAGRPVWTAEMQQGTGWTPAFGANGVFGQTTWDWQDRIFLTAGGRLDWHRAEEEFVRLYPKADAAWVVSEEGFWPKRLGTVRLRAAFGQVGGAREAGDGPVTSFIAQPPLENEPAPETRQ